MVNAFILIVAAFVGVIVAIGLIMFVVVPLFKAIGFVFGQIGRFVGGMLADSFRLVGAIITAVVFVPLVLGNVVIGRWSAVAHFWRALTNEFVTVGRCAYRLSIGHVARLFCLTPMLEGLEQRVPQAMAGTPGADAPSKRTGQFDGYTIVGSLAGGGSGGKLYVAQPDALKKASLERQGAPGVERVVIKSFSLHEGSQLPQIVREGRALDAAKKLGLVLEHQLSNERFYYVMRYVPGESLSTVINRLHGQGDGGGLTKGELRQGMGYVKQLLDTLHHYHSGGLWHKDVKPDNIIVSADEAHLVDFGLVTPLRSAMTLTTHGTEYFRDPELVRMALRGVKVSEVDGQRFDVYGAGAVLYQMVENSFPAHGGLSQVTKRCPEALRWILRRSMTDYEKRYPSAKAMAADLDVLLGANDPFAVRPADLPSMKGEPVVIPEPVHDEFVNMAAASHTPAGAKAHAHAEAAAVAAAVSPDPEVKGFGVSATIGKGPKIKVVNWWTGHHAKQADEPATPAPVTPAAQAHPARPSTYGHPLGLSAAEQRKRAFARASEARTRAQENARRRRNAAGRNPDNTSSNGAAAAVGAVVAVGTLVAGGVLVGGLLRDASAPRVFPLPPQDVSEAPSAPEFPWSPIDVAAPDWYSPEFSSPVDPDEAAARLPVRRLAVLRDVSTPSDTLDRFSRVIDELAGMGVEIVGFGGPDTPESREAIAQLRKEIGLRPWNSQSASGAIKNWMQGQSDRFDAVAWIASSPTFGNPASIWFVNGALPNDRFEWLSEQFNEIH